MNMNHNKSTYKKKPRADQLNVLPKRKNNKQEEFGVEHDARQDTAGQKQPVSERTAWH